MSSSSPSLSTLSIDSILSQHGKHIGPGQSITFTLIKGPTSSSADYVAARSTAATTNHNPAAEPIKFPRVAKFNESVQKPDFTGVLKDGRMYEEDVPKVKDESDEEEGTTGTPGGGEGGTEGSSSSSAKNKKRRLRRQEPPKRHWVLQEKQEYFEKMIARRKRQAQRKKGTASGADEDDEHYGQKLSTRYEGVPEANASRYVFLSVSTPTDTNSVNNNGVNGNVDMNGNNNNGTIRPKEQLSAVPVHGFYNFAQPAKFSTLSMHEAERAISDQRGSMTRYMMHGKISSVSDKTGGGVGRGKILGPPPKGGMSKARLLNKLAGKLAANDPDAEDDDVMSDLAFRNRKGATVRARKELLSSLGDEEVTVDDEGVLGGANDSEFGGKRRFGKFAVPKKTSETDSKYEGGSKSGGGALDAQEIRGQSTDTAAAGYDGFAMSDDFYQRDVSAEYEELDFDAKEQFDDDDVDLGEGEMVEQGGFAEDMEEEEEDEFEEEGAAGAISGPEGLETLAGFKALLAKARGETVSEEGSPAAPSDADAKGKRKRDEANAAAGAADSEHVGEEHPSAASQNAGGLSKVIKAAEQATETAKKKKEQVPKVEAPAMSGVELDEHGQRLITLEAIRREIWLHHGAIPMKRLMKIFAIKKKTSPERQHRFRDLVKELCTIKVDRVEGNMLVLKQHYSNMG